jgi:hypothetical protein
LRGANLSFRGDRTTSNESDCDAGKAEFERPGPSKPKLGSLCRNVVGEPR